MSYVKPYWRIFSVSMFGYLIYAATQPMFAALLQYVVDTMQSNKQDSVYWIPIAIVTVMLFRGIGSFLGNYYLAMVGNNVVHTLRCEIFEHYAILPAAYFDDSNSGHLISRVTFNVTQVTDAATEALKIVVREGFTVVGLLGFLIYMNWKLSLIFLALAPIIALLVSIAGKRFRKLSKKIQFSMGNVTHVASELITGFRVVRSFGGEEYEKNRFRQASFENFRQSMKMVKTAAIHTPLLQLIVTIALAILVFLALILMNDASAGEFIAYITAAVLIPKPVRQLSEVNSRIQKGIASAESIFEVLDEPHERDIGQYKVDRVKGKLEFKNLGFTYPSVSKPALRGINYSIEPGQTVALVGQSGSGKTTLANLISRFYDCTEGQVLLDDIQIEQFSLSNLREQIALVTQYITLFNDTIEKNIAYGSLSNLGRQDVIRAAEAANAMEFIEKLPQGLDTITGENGVKLSGGQRQRLAIARALLKDAPILILDEATSALDTESERKIQDALEKVMQGRTTIVIAHRLSTIENADAILVLHDGKMVEQGDHKSLIATGGHYAQLYSSQFRDKRQNHI